MNAMRDIHIEKVVLNVGCGTKMKIDDAKQILENISGKKAIIIKTRKRNTFNVPKNKPIGVKVTIRKGAQEFLKRMFEAKETIKTGNFDSSGNFAFGIKEYIDIPGVDYDPKIGMIGFDVCVALERPGYRVKKKLLSSKVGAKHRITREEAADFVRKNFKVKVEE